MAAAPSSPSSSSAGVVAASPPACPSARRLSQPALQRVASYLCHSARQQQAPAHSVGQLIHISAAGSRGDTCLSVSGTPPHSEASLYLCPTFPLLSQTAGQPNTHPPLVLADEVLGPTQTSTGLSVVVSIRPANEWRKRPRLSAHAALAVQPSPPCPSGPPPVVPVAALVPPVPPRVVGVDALDALQLLVQCRLHQHRPSMQVHTAL